MGRPLVNFSDPRWAMEPISTMFVNRVRDEIYLWTSLLICSVTLVINTAAVVVIGRKEKTGVNLLIVLDSFANMLTALIQLFNSMALTTSSSYQAIFCIFNLAMLFIFATWNRLVPVVLALYRYLLVSHFMKCFWNLGCTGPCEIIFNEYLFEVVSPRLCLNICEYLFEYLFNICLNICLIFV